MEWVTSTSRIFDLLSEEDVHAVDMKIRESVSNKQGSRLTVLLKSITSF